VKLASTKRPRIAHHGAMPRWLSPGWALQRRRGRRGGLLRLFLVLVLLFGLAFLAGRLDPLPPPLAGTAHTADGDSLRLGADRVRLIGIDAPELDQVCWHTDGSEWPCGRVARDRLALALAGATIACAPRGVDKYGRTLARCDVDGIDLGAIMVEEGLAIAESDYVAEQLSARAAGKGIWSGRFTNPREWRKEGPSGDPGSGLFDTIWTWFRELTGARALR
jgi:endonuclease YncB( thermonuclease family)